MPQRDPGTTHNVLTEQERKHFQQMAENKFVKLKKNASVVFMMLTFNLTLGSICVHFFTFKQTNKKYLLGKH